MLDKLKFICVFISLLSTTSCSSWMESDREFAEPVTGAIMIVRDAFSDEDDKDPCPKDKKKREACQKQINDLAESISKAKNKSKIQDEEK
ncbi:MAG: hypothetical protein OEY96_06310 [Gammaproteobacteria bacterium]|nr:hypothetical protein [Gammaproteobacteria bacterium]